MRATLLVLLIWQTSATATPITNPAPTSAPGCIPSLTKLAGRSFFFGKDDTIYILTNSGQRSERRSAETLYKHRVLKLDYKKNNLSVVPNTNLSLPVDTFFLPNSDPPKYYSAVSFLPQNRQCQRGLAHIFLSYTEKYKRQKIVAHKRKVALVDSLPSVRLFDLDVHKLLEVDVYRSQFRRLNNDLTKGETPLYAEPNTGIIYTIKTNNDNTAILRRLDRQESTLAFNVGERVLQHGRFFGVGVIHAQLNRLEILEYPEWSSITDKRRRYLIQVPASYPLSQTEMVIDFENKIIALGGAITLTKRTWRKTLFYNYKQGKLIHTFEYEQGLLPNGMAVHPAGGYIAIDMVRQNNYRNVYLALFDIKKNKMRKLSLRPRKNK
ncbi:MAG: hypothetical protein OYH77_02065 [Pseudomonadota bacterium]|nr:hypothetical protein [Pseudomonadota bacterium]